MKRVAVPQLAGVVKLQAYPVPTREIGAGIEQMGFAAIGPAPDPELNLILAEHDGLEAGDDQAGPVGKIIIETELAIERQR